MIWYNTQLMRLGIAADVIASTLDGVKVGLTLSPVAAGEATLLSDLTAAHATFAGYAKGLVTWADPSVSDDGVVEVIGDVPEFRPTDAVTPNSVYNVWVEDAGAAILYSVALFDTPIPMQSALDSLRITLRWRPQTQMLSVLIS